MLEVRKGGEPFSVEQCTGRWDQNNRGDLGRTLMSRSDSSDFIASRIQVRLTPNFSMSCFSVGNFSPGFIWPLLMRWKDMIDNLRRKRV